MVNAYLMIETEPARIQELTEELAGMTLDHTVIKSVHAVSGQYNLIAFVEGPTMQDIANCTAEGIANVVGIRQINIAYVIY